MFLYSCSIWWTPNALAMHMLDLPLGLVHFSGDQFATDPNPDPNPNSVQQSTQFFYLSESKK